MASAGDLDHLVRWGRQRAAARVLDMATGGGHIALAFAGFTPTVVATDPMPSVLRATRRFIASHGVAGVHVLAADGLALPFRDESVGVVICRLAAHHFRELLPVLRQVARVLRRAGSFLLADSCATMTPRSPRSPWRWRSAGTRATCARSVRSSGPRSFAPPA